MPIPCLCLHAAPKGTVQGNKKLFHAKMTLVSFVRRLVSFLGNINVDLLKVYISLFVCKCMMYCTLLAY